MINFDTIMLHGLHLRKLAGSANTERPTLSVHPTLGVWPPAPPLTHGYNRQNQKA